MIAYNRQNLDNRAIQEQAMEAFTQKAITAEELTRIRESHAYRLYTPNFFIRIGLFVLTVLASACCLGLLMLMELGSGEKGIGFMLIFYGIVNYSALEFFIQARKVYRSGVDDALLWTGGCLVVTGIDFIANHITPAVQSLIILLLAAGCVWRYADRLMALVAYGALISLVFTVVVGWGTTARALLPFIVMAISVLLYLLFTRLSLAPRLRHYHSCLTLLRAAALLSLYLAGNYYVVREMNTSITGLSAPVSLGFLWWTLTAVLPVVYIVKGIQKKDVVFLWMGLGLAAATIFTVRYYYHVLPAELAMIIAGVVLIAGAYGLIRYLHIPRRGCTSEAPVEPHVLERLPIESLLQAETFHSAGAPPDGTGVRLGGGTTGGGGAGGDY